MQQLSVPAKAVTVIVAGRCSQLKKRNITTQAAKKTDNA
jgi:hypothetical protein